MHFVRFVIGSLFLLAFAPGFPQVILNEVMFDPDGSDYTDEFVEILNLGETDSVDLTGWHFGDSSGDDQILDAGRGLILRPGQYGLILDPDYFGSSALYDYLIPEGTLILTVEGTTLGSGGLSNSTPETVMLLNAGGNVVAEYTYSVGNSPGHSDEKVDPAGSDDPGNWEDSSVLNGTPGFQNSVCVPVLPGGTTITVSPNPFSPDGDGFEDVTTISYLLPMKASRVTLRIYDVRGRRIRTLLGAWLSGCQGVVVWDGRDDAGRSARPGIYVVFIEGLDSVGGTVVSAKATVVLAERL